MKTFFIAFLLISVLTGVTQSPQAFAKSSVVIKDHTILLAQQGNKMSPSEAAKRAQKQYGGKVVGSPSCKETDSGTVCTVRLDIDGRIKTVTIRG